MMSPDLAAVSALAAGASSDGCSGKSGQKFSKLSQNEPKFGISDDCADRVVAFLVARHPEKAAEAIEAETGIAASTARKWLAGSSRPSFVACLTLIQVYGPEFLAAVLDRPPVWISRAASAADAERTRAQIAALQRRLDRSLSEDAP